LAPAVEHFNAAQHEFRTELRYVDPLYTSVRLAETPPDLVVGSAIEALRPHLRSLDDIVDGDPLDADAFYRSQLEQLRWDGDLKLLPVSFNLPMMVFQDGDLRNTYGAVLDPQAVLKLSLDHVQERDGRLTSLGYSPRWSLDFAYSVLRVFGVTFQEAGETLSWDHERLDAAISRLASWGDGTEEWLEREQAFSHRYLYEPPPKLIRSGRIRFAYDESHRFFSAPEEQTRGLAFRWLGAVGAIPVLDTQTLLGIPHRAGNVAGARAFTAWLLQESTQHELLAWTTRTTATGFGAVGGFSGLWRVNEELFPRYYPELGDAMPSGGWMEFPPPAPALWPQTKSQVILPWIDDMINGRQQGMELQSRVSLWLMQQER
jgi:hypothetical protein